MAELHRLCSSSSVPTLILKKFPVLVASSTYNFQHISMTSNQSNGETVLVDDLSSLTVKDSPAATEPPEEAPHRSHNPENNLKRSDPFQFGSRLLSEEDNVYEFNAWDHVETDDTYKEYAELQYAKQREAPVSEFDKSTFPIPIS